MSLQTNSNDSDIPEFVLQHRDMWKEQYRLCGVRFPTICVTHEGKRFIFPWVSKDKKKIASGKQSKIQS